MPRYPLLSTTALPLLLVLTTFTGPLSAQTEEDEIVRTATAVINEIMAIPARRIPHSLLVNADGIAIIPDVVKVGLIGGVRHGDGVLLVRDARGGWTAPTFITLTGGSIGWQAGVQATDAVLVFNTKRSIEGLSQGKFTIGVDAAAAAGPVGRNAAAATDARLQAEILTYSRSRGLFAGVSIDGSVLQIDSFANAVYYQGMGMAAAPGVAGSVVVPESAATLVRTVSYYTLPPEVATAQTSADPAAQAGQPVAPPALFLDGMAGAGPDAVGLRSRLADSATRLNAVLDDRWRQYLALPSEIFTGTSPPSVQALNTSLAKYDRVARDAQYGALAGRPEFQATHNLLHRYTTGQWTPRTATLPLPAPPAQTQMDTRQRY